MAIEVRGLKIYNDPDEMRQIYSNKVKSISFSRFVGFFLFIYFKIDLKTTEPILKILTLQHAIFLLSD